MNRINIAITIMMIFEAAAFGQVAFQNLNFEAANVSGYFPDANNLPIVDGMPGWTAMYSSGTQPTPIIWYDAVSGAGPVIAINDAKTGWGFSPLVGNFSAALFAGPNPPFGSAATSISQTGMIPVGTKSLLMDAVYSLVPFVVSINGDNLVMISLGRGPGAYQIYGGDISQYAGQAATLAITEPPPVVGLLPVNPSSVYLDNIVFSPNAIPEPSATALALFGAGVIGAIRYASSRHS